MSSIDDTSRPFLNVPEPHPKYYDENPAWKCRHKSGPNVRNLVVCIDGTANQFGEKNTNVIELYSLIRKEVGSNQLTWYNSGIGTYARPHWRSLKYCLQVIDHKIDLAIAWNFQRTILGAYRWLSENYQEGDRIFLFGFSRGAFQVRVLAAMIDKVGLIHKGNEEQIPFAYELYADLETGPMAKRFKKAFSHHNADIHFVGAWDTVSSIGLVRGRHMLPGTVDGMKHVCYFRHALALDERRVKFSPEYAYGGSATSPSESNTMPPAQSPQEHHDTKADTPSQTLEVWFPGTHSDIGGGNVLNETMDRSRPPLRWMVFESSTAGLRTEPFPDVLSPDKQIELKESLTGVWWLLEYLPLNRLTYTRKWGRNQTTHKPHMGKARKIHNGQKIHGSLILTNKGKDEYTPKARPLSTNFDFWERCRTTGLGEWKAVDLFEGTQDLVNRFLVQQDVGVWDLLRRTAMTVDGRQAVYDATWGALQISSDTVSQATFPIIVELIAKITEILDQTERKDTPLRNFDFEKIRTVFDKWRGSDNENLVAISQTFLRRFTTFKPRLEVVGHRWAIPSIAVFPDGGRIVSVFLDYTIQVWDTVKGTPIGEHFNGHTNVINVVVVSPNGRVVVSGSKDGTIRLWDATTGMAMAAPLRGHTKSIRSLAITPDGKRVASGSEDNTVRIWNVARGTQVGEPLRGPTRTSIVCAIGFSGDGSQIVSCSLDRIVRVWDIETHQPVAEPLNLGQEYLFSITLSPDAKLVVAGFRDTTVCVWDLEHRRMVGKPFGAQGAGVCSVAFSPDGRKVASGSFDGTVLVWDVETQISENRFQHDGVVTAIAFFSRRRKGSDKQRWDNQNMGS